MTSKTLKAAGWLAMSSAFLALPLVFTSLNLEGRTDIVSTVIQMSIQIIGIFLFVAIAIYFKKLLGAVFDFHTIDININLMIIGTIVTGLLSIFALYFTPLKESIGSIVIVILVAQGMVQVQLGYKLLKLPNDFGGMLKPFCFVTMATGILLTTIILIPFAIPLSAISDLMLGTIFLNVSKQLQEENMKRE